jgi:hypothetical protein
VGDLQALQVIPGITAFFFDDDKTLGHEADALLEEGPDSTTPLLNGPAHQQGGPFPMMISDFERGPL